MTHRRAVLALLVVLSFPVAAQQSVTYVPDWSEVWTNPGVLTRHYSQPLSMFPDATAGNCPRNEGYGMGLFKVRNGFMQVFQARDTTIQPGPTFIGDHLDAFFRDNATGGYSRVLGFFQLPQQQYIISQGDASVVDGGTLPGLENLQWQIGSGFAPVAGPPLTSDAPTVTRVYAFFAPESYPYDQAIGGHLIGFASYPVGEDGPFAMPWSGAWKNALSWNDSESKLTRGAPMRTLYLTNFTPVIAFRGDGAITTPAKAGARYVGGLTGWFDNGHFYLMLSTLLSSSLPNPSCPAYTAHAIGMLLFRVQWDAARADTGGLAMDAQGRPHVELYYSESPTTEKYFHPLPYPDQVISFSDDGKPWNCTSPSRQQFSGCCSNPPVPAGYAMIGGLGTSGEYYLPSSTYLAPSKMSFYTTLSKNATGNPAVDEPYVAKILRVARTGLAAPAFAFSEADTVVHPTPSSYYVAGAYQACLPNIGQLENGVMFGYRHVHSSITNCEGQYAFTIPKSPERSGFYTLTPCRLLDTRNPTGPLGGPSLAAGESRIFPLGGTCNVPATAKSLSLNVTAVPSADGSITAYAGGLDAPGTSIVSFRAGKVRSNNAQLGVGGLATLNVKNNSSGPVDVILDVNGFFE